MNKSQNKYSLLVRNLLLFSILLTSCQKKDNPIKFPHGTFPNTTINLEAINSQYDDYNIGLYQITENTPIIFSSNRRSSGGQFDLEQASFSFIFDQTNGNFTLEASMTDDPFLKKLINTANTAGNDLGPFRLFSTTDGYEYLILSSVNPAGNLDLFYLKNRPVFDSNLPDITGPFPIKLFNTSFDEAYICFDPNQDSAYFASNRDGNYDIYVQGRTPKKDLSWWFNLDFATSAKADSVNSDNDDKCPIIFKKIMVFSSDRPGGFGGYDLYYSIFRKGKWSSPVNFGPEINTSSDEYRPVIGYHPDFTNYFMMFSSNRPGGKGGFDLYFTGIELPEK